MREERITINILTWLENNNWQIICYDFPQSGTGILLHPNSDARTEKNKGGIIPDIIAIKDNIGVFFENKDRFYLPDFEKLFDIKNQSYYSVSLDSLLQDYNINTIFYGIGISYNKNEIEKCIKHISKVDFLLSTNEKKEILVHYDIKKIF